MNVKGVKTITVTIFGVNASTTTVVLPVGVGTATQEME